MYNSKIKSVDLKETAPLRIALLRDIGPLSFKVTTADNPDMQRTLDAREELIKEIFSSTNADTTEFKKKAYAIIENEVIQRTNELELTEECSDVIQSTLSEIKILLLWKSSTSSLEEMIKLKEVVRQQLINKDALIAYAQHQNLINKMIKNGIKVLLTLEDRKNEELYTDQIFNTDTGKYFEIDGKLYFLTAKFNNEARIGEQRLSQSQAENFGAKILNIGENNFEGGDLRLMPEKNVIFVGYGHRATDATVKALKEIPVLNQNFSINGIELLREQFYHLDCCFLPLPNDCALIYEGNNEDQSLTMSANSKGIIQSHYPDGKLIKISEEEALNFATNAAVLKNSKDKYIMFVSKGALKRETKDQIFRECPNIKIEEVPYEVMHTSGGSVRCTVQEIPVSSPDLSNFFESARIDQSPSLKLAIQSTLSINAVCRPTTAF